MCGIAGIYGESNEVLLNNMLSCISHRGPDDKGVYFDEGNSVAMGMRRLSIIDIEGGDQPISNENGTVHVTFNGEIYNYASLKKHLESKDHTFSTQSDTEVLVHLWEEYRSEMVEYLDGMFAFSLWDETRGSLFLARDRLGIKPLYYTRIGDDFLWGSELPSILAYQHNWSVNDRSLFQFLNFSYFPHPQTIVNEIYKVPPGSFLLVNDGEVSQNKYWQLNPGYIDSSAKDIASNVRSLLENAVERRLMSDVPVGAFLSGGIDSSAIVALASQMKDKPLKTYSIGFDDPEYDESTEAEFVADYFKTEHSTVDFDIHRTDLITNAVKSHGVPLADPAILPSLQLAERASEDVKVVLTGEGADEIFGGYPKYKMVPKHRQLFNQVPSAIHDFAGKVDQLIPSQGNHLQYFKALDTDDQIIYQTSKQFEENPSTYTNLRDMEELSTKLVADSTKQANGSTLQKLTLFDIDYWLSDDLLYKLDQSTMAASVEGRVPFLDTQLVQYAYQIPYQFKIGQHGLKSILKIAVSDLLPERTLNRKKHGFSVPTSEMIRNEHPSVVKWLKKDFVKAVPYISNRKIQNMYQEHIHGKEDHGTKLWKIINYTAWYNIYLEE